MTREDFLIISELITKLELQESTVLPWCVALRESCVFEDDISIVHTYVSI